VLYEFWATWCTPCHVQVEILSDLYPRARARGMEFLAIATGEPEDIVRAHLAKSPYPYPVALDPEERIGTALEVVGLPTLIVADRSGRVVWRRTGLVDGATLERALEEAARAEP
jgi:thiol-disulfide isomerase/thioredoxin